MSESAASTATTSLEEQSIAVAKKWHDSEVNLDLIKDQTIAVIGYGIQGRAQASNMKDSGMNVVVGIRRP